MSNYSGDKVHPLPDRPNLRHLKNQARDLMKAGRAGSISDAQFKIARLYGFASWPRLKAHVDSLAEIGSLKLAIDNNDFERVKDLMTRNPSLHTAPVGYAKNGPLTWVAECRNSPRRPEPLRLAMAQWMIENGSDVHQGGDGPLMRASLRGERIPMMELLVRHGANVNAQWNGDFPILFAPCETVDPVAIRWLLEHGADPNCPGQRRHITALDYLIGTYVRSPELGQCIELLVNANGTSRYDLPGVIDTIQGNLERLSAHLDEDPDLIRRRFPELDCGSTGTRRLLLLGATLLHVAAEFGSLRAAMLLIDRGADVNARAGVDDAGIGGQTPIFHAATQFQDRGLAMTQLLVNHGADLSIRVKLPGHYERLEEVVECTPLGYALRFPEDNRGMIALLQARGGLE